MHDLGASIFTVVIPSSSPSPSLGPPTKILHRQERPAVRRTWRSVRLPSLSHSA